LIFEIYPYGQVLSFEICALVLILVKWRLYGQTEINKEEVASKRGYITF